MSIRCGGLILLAALLGGITRPGAAQSMAPVYDPANGHWYQTVRVAGAISWDDARKAAESLSYAGYPGHLVTVTSAAESQFIAGSVLSPAPNNDRLWLGGYQDGSAPDYIEPAGGWRWVTGEPWSYTNWYPGEPNNYGGNEDAIEFHGGPTWNDFPRGAGLNGYVIEYEPTPINTGPLLSLSPNPVTGGQTATGQLILPQPAGLGGVVITLSSSNPAAAAVPASLTIPTGANSFSFPVVTFAVGSATAVAINAVSAGGAATATLQVLPGPNPAPNPPPVGGAPVYNPTNGHWYQLVRVPGQINWPDARNAAQALYYAGYPGHLATITSADEAQFINANITGKSGLDIVWLGGYQDSSASDYREPDGGWRWVTGEPWSYTNWHPGEPNDSPHDSNALELAVVWGGQWDDRLAREALLPGYVVEFEPAPAVTPGPTPAPTTSAQLLLFPNPALGGQPALGQIALSQAAGVGGLIVTLTSSNPAVVVPAMVTVPAGASSATFVIITLPVALPTPVTITAGGSFGSATAVLQLLTLAVPPPAGGNLLVNGGFELPVVPPGRANQTLSGPGDLPGWRILRGTVDVVPSLPSDWQPAPDGGRQSLDLVGTPGAATIEQTFPTQPGQDYVFSGWLSHNWGIPEGRANVFLNGAFFVQLDHNTPNSAQDMKWTFFSYPFRATAATTTLTIADVTHLSDVRGTALDGLSVTLASGANSPVPTPAASLAAPSNLTASMAIEAHVRLAWIDNSGGETGFTVWRKVGGSDWAKIALLPANSTTFTDAGVSPSTLYTYRVQATNGTTTSDWSNEASLTTPAAPAAPTGLTATIVGANQVALAWSVNPSNATAVEIYRKGGGADWKLIAVVAPGSTGYQDRGVAPGTNYTYRVCAANDYFASGWSNEAGVTTSDGL